MFLLEGVEVSLESIHNGQYVEDNNNEVGRARRHEEETDPETTLYALVGSPSLGTMRVKGRVNSVPLVILVDSSSTHNFIDAAVVPVLHVLVDESQILEVKVANGDIIQTQGLCKDVQVCVQGQTFLDRKSTRLNSSHLPTSRMPSSA